MDKKTIKMFSYIIGAFVGFILILFIISSCTKKTYTFEKLENRMTEIAKETMKSDESQLPSQDKDTKIITLKSMISDGKIDDISKLFKRDDLKCSGSVTITNNNGFYNYSTYLSCGNEYESKYLNEKIIEDNKVDAGVGLHEIKGSYVMQGEVKNNYIKMGDRLFRIIRINGDGTIRVMEITGLNQKVWDNRYNPETRYSEGINEFEYNSLNSRLRDTLHDYYENSKIWPDSIKQYITTQSLCIGKRNIKDTSKDGSVECSKIQENEVLGLITPYEYLQGSLDQNCSLVDSSSCANYNWLSKLEQATWSMTANSENTKSAYILDRVMNVYSCSSTSGILAVFNLTDKAIYVSGDGSVDKPYIFK